MKVGAIQTRWHEDTGENLNYVYEAVDEACEHENFDFICLPEFFLGPAWYMPGQGHLKGLTDTPIPGPVVNLFCKLAKKHNTYIICGSVVEELKDGKYCNTSVLINRDGIVIGHANKLHPFANEAVVCQAGNTIDVHDTEYGPIGIAVCSDFWIPETIRMLALKGAKTVFIPGGSLKQNIDAMINAVRTTAYLNCINMVYCSPVGQVHGIRGNQKITVEFAGTSLIATPHEIVAQASMDQQEVITATLSVEHIEALRIPNHDDDTWFSLQQRHPEFYAGLLRDYVDGNRDLVAETQIRMQQTRSSEQAGLEQSS